MRLRKIFPIMKCLETVNSDRLISCLLSSISLKMPFTPTHILAVLPVHFTFRRLSLSALVVGTMIPDFTMFYPISDYHFSHSGVGLIGYCLPAGLLIYYLWELYGKILAIDLCPLWVRCRINDYRNIKPQYEPIDLFMIAIAILIGSLTHIVWDAFTHESRWGVELIPSLKQTFEIFNIALPGYKVFQYGSTSIGLPLLAVLCFFYLNRIQTSGDLNYHFCDILSS